MKHPTDDETVAVASNNGWRQESTENSLPEVHGSLLVPQNVNFWRKLLAFSGPGYLVAVGYMDPGNWATDIAAGSRFNYSLLCVVMASNLLAILLQNLSLRLGIATGRDLAQACRDSYPRPIVWMLWVLCEIAIAACDLAEVIGSAIALNLLFHLPLIWGVCLTSLDVIMVLAMQNRGFRFLETLVVTLIGSIGLCFAVELFFSHPDAGGVARGFLPVPGILLNRDMLYISIGIVGATVMPHNLYLHSSIVQTRKYQQTSGGRREAVKFASIDSTLALCLALFINAAILIVAAATFHRTGHYHVQEIRDAYRMLAPLLGAPIASTLFACALLGSGQNSTLTGTLAGQIVMEGFLHIRLRPWLRRLLTRLIAIIPAVIVAYFYGDSGAEQLLIFSQVVLSLQLSFAVVPLVMFTGDKKKMGEFANSPKLQLVCWVAAAIIAGLNGWLLWTTAATYLATGKFS